MRTVGAREFLGSFRTYIRGSLATMLVALLVGGALALLLQGRDENVYYTEIGYAAPMDPREHYLINGQQIAVGAAQNYATLLNSDAVTSSLERELGGHGLIRETKTTIAIEAANGGPIVSIEVRGSDDAFARRAVEYYAAVAIDTSRPAMPVDVDGQPVVTPTVTTPLEVRPVDSSALTTYVFVLAFALFAGIAYTYLRGATDRIVRSRSSLCELDDGTPLGVETTVLGSVGTSEGSRLAGMLNPAPGARYHVIDLTGSRLGMYAAFALAANVVTQGMRVRLLDGTGNGSEAGRDGLGGLQPAVADGLEIVSVPFANLDEAYGERALWDEVISAFGDDSEVVIAVSAGPLRSAAAWHATRVASRNLVLAEMGTSRRREVHQVVSEIRARGEASCEILVLAQRDR